MKWGTLVPGEVRDISALLKFHLGQSNLNTTGLISTNILDSDQIMHHLGSQKRNWLFKSLTGKLNNSELRPEWPLSTFGSGHWTFLSFLTMKCEDIHSGTHTWNTSTHTHIHTHALTHTHTNTHALTHTRTHAHTHSCTYTHARTHTHSCTYTHLRTRTHSCTYTHTRTHAHTHACGLAREHRLVETWKIFKV